MRHSDTPADFFCTDLIDSGSPQRPQQKGSMADAQITLQDPIMMDDMILEEKLDQILKQYLSAHCECVRGSVGPRTDLGCDCRCARPSAFQGITNE